jgi:hypothetical protein
VTGRGFLLTVLTASYGAGPSGFWTENRALSFTGVRRLAREGYHGGGLSGLCQRHRRHGWVGIFFVVSAEVGGRDAAGLPSGAVFAALATLVTVATLVGGPASTASGWSRRVRDSMAADATTRRDRR